MFAINMFPVYIKVLFHIFYSYWGEEYRLLFITRDKPLRGRLNAVESFIKP